MDRQKYNACMRPFITGSKPKEQRKLDFCVGAKICSGKAKSKEEAEKLCSLPKEPREPKIKRKQSPQTCEKEAIKLTQCMVPKIDMDLASNINSIGTAIINAMVECKCPK